MTLTPPPPQFGSEIREWAVRVVLSEEPTKGRAAAIANVAKKVGCTPKTLKQWMRKVDAAGGFRPGLFSTPKQRLAELEREVAHLKRANELLRTEVRSLRIGRPPEGPADMNGLGHSD